MLIEFLLCAGIVYFIAAILYRLYDRFFPTIPYQGSHHSSSDEFVAWDTAATQYKEDKAKLTEFKKRHRGVSESVLESIEELKDKEKSLNRIIDQYSFEEKEAYLQMKEEAEYLTNTEFPKTHIHEHNREKRRKESQIESAKKRMMKEAEQIYEQELKQAKDLVESKKPLSEAEKLEARQAYERMRTYRADEAELTNVLKRDRQEYDEKKAEKVAELHQNSEDKYAKIKFFVLIYLILVFISLLFNMK